MRKIVEWHSESQTLYYIVEIRGEDWEIVKTCHSMREALRERGNV